MAMMQFQQLAIILTLIALSEWICALVICLRRNGNSTRYFLYGGVFMVSTLFGIGVLDGGGSLTMLSLLLLLGGFAAVALEADAWQQQQKQAQHPEPPEPIA